MMTFIEGKGFRMRRHACLLFVLLTLTACGKKGPLIYPDMLVPAAPSDVSARQSGNNVRLTFTLPSKDRAGQPHPDVAGVKIVKRDSLTGQDPGCTACTSDFALFKKWFADIPGEAQVSGKRVVLLDGAVMSGRSYTYKISAFTKDDLDGAVATPVTANVVQPPLPPVLRAVSQPTEVMLELAGLPLEGTFVGYSLYRAVKGDPFSYLPYVGSLLKENRFADMALERGVTYVYAARTVIRLSSGTLVESGLSNEVEGKLKDDE
jgi:predicted small lipoprotein YifL